MVYEKCLYQEIKLLKWGEIKDGRNFQTEMEIPLASLNYIINKYLISRLTTYILMTSTCMRTCIEVLKKKIQ